MLTLYRLHGPQCKKGYRRPDRNGASCACMIHVEGKLGDRFLRISTKTRSMERARAIVVEAERRGSWLAPEEKPSAVTGKLISEAIAEFLADAADEKSRNLAAPTLIKYRTVLVRLNKFSDRRGLIVLSELTYAQLAAFRREWPTGSLATAHNVTRLRTFFAWALKHSWITSNPAEQLEPPRETPIEREPYTDEEMSAILDIARTIELDPQQPITNDELETFILVQRWAGLAISDTALLETAELRGDEIRLYRNKTARNAKRVLVVVPLPPFVLARLKRLPLKHGRYYFAHNTPTLAAQVEAWRKRLSFVFEAANITNPGSHRFRHTFATDLLTRGASIELVSRWLGHSSIKITQAHYSHWIETRIKASSDVLRQMYASQK